MLVAEGVAEGEELESNVLQVIRSRPAYTRLRVRDYVSNLLDGFSSRLPVCGRQESKRTASDLAPLARLGDLRMSAAGGRDRSRNLRKGNEF
jgi:hypothetical protein